MSFRNVTFELFERINQRFKRLGSSSKKFPRSLTVSAIETQMREILRDIAVTMPDNPMLKGARVYNQCDEDGIVFEIVRRIGLKNKLSNTLVEIGCSNGLENMTHGLMLAGYRGVWIDGSSKSIAEIHAELGGADFPALKIKQIFVDPDNIKIIMKDSLEFFGSNDIDVLSIDIDGNDLHVFKSALSVTKPKLIIAEYNAKFIPPIKITIDYNAEHIWKHDDYFGSSLQMLVDEFVDYRLVACSISGANAFFVRKDMATSFVTYPPEQIFQPSRYHLIGRSNDHKPSLKFLKQYVSKS